MTDKTLLQHLNFKIDQVASGEWGGRAAPRLRLAEGAGQAQDGRLHGAAEVTIATRTGEAVLSAIDLSVLKTTQDIDDAFADTLSRILMNHHKWPR
jgi:hypothetical protein